MENSDDTNFVEDARLRNRTAGRDTNLSSDDDMLEVNNVGSHHGENTVLSEHVRIDDASSHSE